MKISTFTVIVALVATAPAVAETLGSDLCAYKVEGLSLESTNAEVAAVFSVRGWHDLSSLESRKANGVRVERIEFDRTRKSDTPEEIKADKDGPIGRFQLIREDGGDRSIKLSDYASAPPVDRARALCAAATGKFEVTGCEERFLSRDAFGIIIRPRSVAPGETSCIVSFNGQKTFYGQTYAISVVKQAHYGRGQPGRKHVRE